MHGFGVVARVCGVELQARRKPKKRPHKLGEVHPFLLLPALFPSLLPACEEGGGEEGGGDGFVGQAGLKSLRVKEGGRERGREGGREVVGGRSRQGGREGGKVREGGREGEREDVPLEIPCSTLGWRRKDRG